MSNSVAFLFILSLVAPCTVALLEPGHKPQELSPNAEQLLSENRADRERALETMTGRYVDGRRDLTIVLEKAAREQRGNDRYMSPLHVAVLAVGNCRVFEAESTLLSIIDYELDARSLPDGLNVSGDYFYPAAGALVSLRVDTKKVVNAMVVTAKTDRQLQLMTWVLFQRAGSADEAKRILLTSGGEDNENLGKALALLDRAPDLLPPRST